jgi:NAD(P)-dependent dehydrogenase (short-subunit alcohol dehydrogenase family)
MNENSQGQIILVTGAGSGIGRTTAIELARASVANSRSQRRVLATGEPCRAAGDAAGR